MKSSDSPQGQIIEWSGAMIGGGSKAMRGRMGPPAIIEILEEEAHKMESQQEKYYKQAVQVQEQKAQLEEVVVVKTQ